MKIQVPSNICYNNSIKPFYREKGCHFNINMINIEIQDCIKDIIGSQIAIGAIEAAVKVKESDPALTEEISLLSNKIAALYSLPEISKIDNIHAAREAYKGFGKDPSRYRVSSESLTRRIVKGNGLYKVNNIVDINNLISIYSSHSVCSYDMDKIDTEIYFTLGKEGESYRGIGKGQVNLSNMPVFEDSRGKFGSTTSDSTRAMITEGTRKLLMNIVSFNGDKNLEKYMSYSKDLLIKYAEGEILYTHVIK
ncbi:B3/4 domain-containing protein [Clostridium sp. MT-14]|uniref:B3/B4 tRNA-binding domain-containing protein n=2 Tax=Clostridium aromativorans TaxID=2836848 RepID=A0ABS8N5F7_9CLOT|nr:hypothetical protein [Clostridium aromativorans]CAB1239171.1 B3_4 domain-containing protein [Clostridiaceae bacterium BL-3]